MMRNRRVGTLPHAREGSGPRVEPIDPPDDSALVHMDLQHSDENALGPELIDNSLLPPFDRTDQRLVNLLFRIRTNNYLKSLANFSGPNRRRSSARFFTVIAAVTSLLTTCVCDILFFLIPDILLAPSSVDTGQHCRPSTSSMGWWSNRLFCRSLDIQRNRPLPQCSSWAVSPALVVCSTAQPTTLRCALQLTCVLGYQKRHLSWCRYCFS